MIWWEGDNITPCSTAAEAKQPLLRLISHTVPADGDEASLYRPTLERGDFCVYNTPIIMDAHGQPAVTSFYGWETGCIAGYPFASVTVNLVMDENGTPEITRVPDQETPDERAEYMTWARQYFMVRPSFKHHLPQCTNGGVWW